MFVFFSILKLKYRFAMSLSLSGANIIKKNLTTKKKKKKNEKKFFSSFDSAKIWRFFIMTHGDNLSP